MAKEKIELSLQDESGQECVAYPFVESTDVSLSNGMDIETMIAQDVSMPIVTHEETSFKVGVGDSDISNSIVDSSVANMTIKGQTYQNILPEPSTHVLSNNKEMFKVNEGLDPNVEIVDGVSKSAILKGQTLVNGLSNPRINIGGECVTILSPTHLLINHGENTSGKRVSVNYDWLGGKMRDGADYTLDIWILKNTMRRKDNPTERIGKINFNNYNTGFYSIPTGKTGHIVYEVTTATTSTTERPYIETFTTCEGELEIQMVIREGKNLIPIEQHFEGMASCKMPVLTTTGKNLFDGNLINGYYEDGTLNKIIGGNENIYKTIKLNLKKGTYTFSFEESVRFIRQVKDGVYEVLGGDFTKFTTTLNTDGIYVLSFRKTDNTDFDLTHIQVEQGSIATSYEPYKSNILHTPEEVVLKGIGDLKDTLNCNTGEYVERIGEYIITGDENWNTNTQNDCQRFSFYHTNIPIIRNSGYSDSKIYVNCDKLAGVVWSNSWNTLNTITTNNGSIYFHLPLETTMEQAKTMMIGTKIQYVLETPTVKTVDLSTSGNWEKVVLDGSEYWRADENHYCFCHNLQINSACAFTDSIPVLPTKTYSLPSHASFSGARYFTVLIDGILNDPAKLKQYLRQNPLTVWYQTATHQDPTQVKQPIFFKDGHIIQSSGADNSLIPTLDYQAKTSNSYVMDLMKTNTKYTMKAKSASGTFTIDGASYGAGANGTFTSPTSMTNKLLVMSNKTNEEVMILEGDVTSKAIPYFKGIKSAFEDESKMEVLSTGKNLFDINSVVLSKYGRIEGNSVILDIDREGTFSNAGKFEWVVPNGMKGKTITLKADKNGGGNIEFRQYDKSNNQLYVAVSSGVSTTILDDTYKIQLNFNARLSSGVTTWSNVRLVVGTDITYEPYKSNSTKIPLLSPLRSLPNGVRDEIMLDRVNHKAKIVQRVGKVMVTTPQVSKWYMDNNGVTNVSRIRLEIDSLGARKNQKQMISNLVPATGRGFNFDEETIYMDDAQNYWLWLHVSNKRLPAPTIEGFKSWLSQNPLVTYYELETPIITEVDLSGYPYIYKDGHIFLNGEITPVTEIKYSINQQHQIEASNQDIMRHQKEIDYLYKLIGEYVRVDYKNTLLALNLELK